MEQGELTIGNLAEKQGNQFQFLYFLWVDLTKTMLDTQSKQFRLLILTFEVVFGLMGNLILKNLRTFLMQLDSKINDEKEVQRHNMRIGF